MIGQAVFLLCGYGVHIFLARRFGPSLYGNFGVVISILVWFELAVIRGLPTAIQKFIAEDQDNVYAIKRFFLYWQVLIAALLFLILFAAAPLIAAALHDDRLTDFIRVAAFDLIIYAIYALYLSVQNGLREFRKQAIIISSYAVVRLVSIFTLVLLGLSLTGALIGNIIGSLGGLVLGIRFCKLEKKESAPFHKKKLIMFAVPTTLFFVVSNLLYNIDLWYVKSLLVNEAAGYYASAQFLARVPLFVFFALSFTLLPLLSQAIKERKDEDAQHYISQAVRILALVLIPMIFLVLSTSEPLVEMLYSAQYKPSAPILNVLIVAFSLLAFYTCMSTVLIAKNQPMKVFVMTLCLVVFDMILITKLIPRWGTLGAATSTTLTAGIGSLVIGIVVFKEYKLEFRLRYLMKIILASLVVFSISNLYSIKASWLLINYVMLLSVYFGLLVVLNVISRKELAAVKNLILK